MDDTVLNFQRLASLSPSPWYLHFRARGRSVGAAAGRRVAVGNVLGHRHGEEHRFLGHQSHVAPDVARVQRLEVDAVHRDGA